MKLLSTIFFTGAVAGFCATASFASEQCPELASVQRLKESPPPKEAKVSEWASYETAIWSEWKAASRNIFGSYISGKMSAQRLEKCLPTSEAREELNLVLPQIFFEESLARLRQSSGPSLQTFLKVLNEKTRGNHLVLFRLLGHFKEATPTPAPGGTERGTGSIFMNFAKINSNDWLIIFTHELLHSIDQRLFSAVEIFADRSLVAEIAEKARTISNPESLDPIFRQRFDRWLLAGLDRGFLAEYRAWSATLKIYEEGKAERLWTNISWIEEVLSKRRRNEALKPFIFRHLDPNFSNPSEGIFSLPLVGSELELLRGKLRQAPPNLANLEEILILPGETPKN